MSTHLDKTPQSEDRLPWYDFSRLWSYNGFYNMVLGARGTGKTFGAKLKGIKDAIHKGHEFIYLRRYKSEMQMAKDGFFTDIVAEGYFPGYDFKVMGNTGYWDYTSNAWMDDDKNVKRPWKPCVYFFALSTGGQIKSQSFPLVKLVIFDEFVIEKGAVQYLPNEVKKFNDFYSTIDRYKGETRALFLSNSVSIMNPYFLEWDVEPRRGEDWLILFDGFIVINFHQSQAFRASVAATPFGRFIEGTEYGDYAVGNEFADNHDLMVAEKPSTAEYYYTLETQYGGTMSVWHDPVEFYWYAQRKRPRSEDIYTLEPRNVSPSKTLLLHNDRMLGVVKTAFRHGRVFFDTAQTRNAFRELL